MRELRLRVPESAAEAVLDRLLPWIPGGARPQRSGAQTELVLRGDDLPPRALLARLARLEQESIEERTVAEDFRVRRREDWHPDLIAGRLLVRPEWAPAAAGDVLDVALRESGAFGAGGHPTTRTLLELLLAEPAGGAFADLGAGSGVLAIVAAKLGFAPVEALEIDPASVEAAAANAALNSVKVRFHVADLLHVPPPQADVFVANCPARVHAAIAAAFPEPLPRAGLLSGYGPAEADAVTSAYAARGLRLERQLEAQGWTVAVVRSEASGAGAHRGRGAKPESQGSPALLAHGPPPPLSQRPHAAGRGDVVTAASPPGGEPRELLRDGPLVVLIARGPEGAAVSLRHAGEGAPISFAVRGAAVADAAPRDLLEPGASVTLLPAGSARQLLAQLVDQGTGTVWTLTLEGLDPAAGQAIVGQLVIGP